MFGLVEFCESVMLLPATNPNAEDEAVFTVPLVAPPAALVIETSVEPVSLMVIVLEFELRLMLLPATMDNAPLDPFSKETLFSALLEALTVKVNDPAPLALAREMLFPPTRAKLTAVPVTDVPPPLRLCVAAAALMEMLCPF